ncbi:PIG-L family deacetylase [Ferruginibacter sp. HRS2-29]|uniref:PIG-L family deacetylase n=1 Tax=Ferruginibacter sp. HRS2-29 TaxID=2487334 RepID=UPI0020CDF0EA|nr:PIG-L family deacetylase [Ferruginibacter sp. HRS2-29]MCP9750589.1 PIG-L family deacetylase [Ferruginibacter sp. HRS2-29]
MKQLFFFLLTVFLFNNVNAQTPKSYSSADILQQMKKLQVFGSVLYIAAHPDDENTRLLAYLANEKKYRTGYLSLTRGDGGQNLIGNEQGIDLGLIRTQELLAARRVDGAEQFFSRAYDFGYSKNPEEAMRIWGHDKILADVVWVIRKFRPDVIITRFPTTGEGGHGHHTASAILAGEAFDAAADTTKFPEQFKEGVTTWKAKRLLWNTFNFGTTNTTRDDQFKIDCGVYNPILGKSYGEIAAESRSQHKSQGFGVPAQRGAAYEYFATIKGDKPVNDLMDGVDVTSGRIGFKNNSTKNEYDSTVKKILQQYDASEPALSVSPLRQLAMILSTNTYSSTEAGIKLADIQKLITACRGLFIEAVAEKQLNAIGDSMKITVNIANRSKTGDIIDINIATYNFGKYEIKAGEFRSIPLTIKLDDQRSLSQPYWLNYPLAGGAFRVDQQDNIGRPELSNMNALFHVEMAFGVGSILQPVQYKYTDPVKGEIYQPVQIINPVFVNTSAPLLLFSNNKKNELKDFSYTLQSNVDINGAATFSNNFGRKQTIIFDSVVNYKKGDKQVVNITLNGDSFPNNSITFLGGDFATKQLKEHQYFSLHKISYDHIPDIFYNYYDQAKIVKLDLKTSGSRAGYIAGAGDKIPEALQQMGYTVTILAEKDLNPSYLKQFDVIVTGVRAYNIHSWLNNGYAALMEYVNEGGVLFVQYNTNNSIGPVKAKIAPYPFNISRNRITDETAKVDFLLPDHPALNFPNKITQSDFDNWIQERSTYHAEAADKHYQKILSMKDPGEAAQDGSLIITDYGKGRFVYSGLVFFRELPAGVPGAYRLFANLIANKR